MLLTRCKVKGFLVELLFCHLGAALQWHHAALCAQGEELVRVPRREDEGLRVDGTEAEAEEPGVQQGRDYEERDTGL